MLKQLIVLMGFCLAFASAAEAQETVLIIRHGERQVEGDDPGLTDAGRARAGQWAEMFRDAGIGVVLTSDASRTRETGNIIAEALGVPREERPVDDIAGLTDLITFDHEGEIVLVVGHTETIPGLLFNLGVMETVTMDKSDFGRFFVVTSAEENPVLLDFRIP